MYIQKDGLFESSGKLTNGIPEESYSYIISSIGTTPIRFRLCLAISSFIPSFYEYLVIDNEAGMEHLSRKTTKHIDKLLLVSDCSPSPSDLPITIKSYPSPSAKQVFNLYCKY